MEDTQAPVTTKNNKLEGLIHGWLDEKASLSGSGKTYTAYQDTLAQFRSALQHQGLDLERQDEESLDKIALIAQAFAGFSVRGRQVAEATRNQRLAILSSFYEYVIRKRVLFINPIDQVKRSKVASYASAQPLTAGRVREAFARIERDTPTGKRDYALLALLLQTGRRLSEVLNLQLQNLTYQDGKIKIDFVRCKGNKRKYDILPHPCSSALLDWLKTYYGQDLVTGTTGDKRPVWLSLANNSHDQPLGQQSVADICLKHLGTSKVHVTRHTWAHLMQEAGAPPSVIQERLGHESLATTGRYLQALSQADNPYADQIGAHLGIR